VRRLAAAGVFAALAVVAGGLLQLEAAAGPLRVAWRTPMRPAPGVRVWKIEYRAHDGHLRPAYVLLPAWYGPHRNPPLPLVISPHGRGVDGLANARLWGRLPALDRLAVVNPDGEGRRLPLYSWGYGGQISDLAKMPALVHEALPWLRVVPDSVYAVAGSMGGQETLLLIAKAPHLLEGAAVFDAPIDLALQYRAFPRFPCNADCLHRWGGPIGRGLQRLAQVEVGGSPAQNPDGYADRSPDHFAAAIDRAKVPLGLWWSTRDRLVHPAGRQETNFVKALERGRSRLSFLRVIGRWPHDQSVRRNLPQALAWLHLARWRG
jgi:pimeloyl-ACP methyl ester carboxylesterase